MKKGQRVYVVMPEKRRLWEHLEHLPVAEGSLQEKWKGTFDKGMQ